jgi:hypothetical protein
LATVFVSGCWGYSWPDHVRPSLVHRSQKNPNPKRIDLKVRLPKALKHSGRTPTPQQPLALRDCFFVIGVILQGISNGILWHGFDSNEQHMRYPRYPKECIITLLLTFLPPAQRKEVVGLHLRKNDSKLSTHASVIILDSSIQCKVNEHCTLDFAKANAVFWQTRLVMECCGSWHCPKHKLG